MPYIYPTHNYDGNILRSYTFTCNNICKKHVSEWKGATRGQPMEPRMQSSEKGNTGNRDRRYDTAKDREHRTGMEGRERG